MTDLTEMGMMNERTGFANGERFASPAEVTAYFTRRNMRDMFGSNDTSPIPTQRELSAMAETVIANEWHCAFPTRLEDTDISIRALTRLRVRGIVYVEELAAWTASDLLAIPQFGQMCLREVEQELARLGLQLNVGPA